MNETSKTIAIWTERERAFCHGHGIDIGCGLDPLPWADVKFDRDAGDANAITRHVHDSFDFVYSAHCLEHMLDPMKCAAEWFSLVKPGGHMVLIVPDEDLYEQGVWPSLFNRDHKHTFTISKRQSWSPVSVNCMDLVASLVDGNLVSIQLQDLRYNRTLLKHGPEHDPLDVRIVRRLTEWASLPRRIGRKYTGRRRKLVDQTLMPDVLAQIQMVIRKRVDRTEP